MKKKWAKATTLFQFRRSLSPTARIGIFLKTEIIFLCISLPSMGTKLRVSCEWGSLKTPNYRFREDGRKERFSNTIFKERTGRYLF